LQEEEGEPVPLEKHFLMPVSLKKVTLLAIVKVTRRQKRKAKIRKRRKAKRELKMTKLTNERDGVKMMKMTLVKTKKELKKKKKKSLNAYHVDADETMRLKKNC